MCFYNAECKIHIYFRDGRKESAYSECCEKHKRGENTVVEKKEGTKYKNKVEEENKGRGRKNNKL